MLSTFVALVTVLVVQIHPAHPACEHVIRTLADTKLYQWDLELPGSSLLTFSVKASHDVFIALSLEQSDRGDLYEIIIGGWGNTQSVIRRSADGPDQTTASTPGILSADELRGFWISWAPDGTIAVGREGEGSPFMQWQDPDPLPFQYFGYTIYGSAGLFRFPCRVCMYPLGMESGAIPDDSITASSIWGVGFEPYRGRLNRVTGGGAWSVTTNTIGEWFQVDLGDMKTVTGTIIQSHHHYDQWVTSYKLQYGVDGLSWITYASSDGSEEVFPGNTERHTPVTNLLDSPTDARYVRFLPQSWHGWMGMRVEVLGCSVDACEHVRRTGETKRYQWDVELPGSSPLIFRAKASNGIFIALSLERSDRGDLYEILIGGWYNKRSVIRRSAEGPALTTVSTPGILSADELRGFWISWAPDGTIAVGREGEGSPFMQWQDPDPLPFQYFQIGYSTGDAPGILPGLPDPAMDLTATRPNCKSRSAPYRKPHGSRRETNRAPDGSRRPEHNQAPTGSRKGTFNCDPDNRRTLGVMTPAGVYTEDMPNGRRFKCCEHVRRTGGTKLYQWDLELPGSSPLIFSIKTSRDAIIALSLERSASGDLYEIIIGGWSNTRSVIRRSAEGPAQTTVATPGILSADELRGFWISWAPDGTIAVGREGEGSPFMQWQDPDPLPIQYFGYATVWGLAGQFIFPCQPCEHVRRTGETKLYQWDLEIPGSSPLTFRVKTSRDVHIALSSERSDRGDLYEIIIGGWGNTQSVICRSAGGPAQTTVSTPGILSADELRGFWISWAPDGTIAVGREGEGSPFMQWQDPEPLPIQYFGYSTYWGSAGQFRFPCKRHPFWSASSESDSKHAAYRADINTRETADAAGAWEAETQNQDQWLMRDLGEVSAISGIVTKGRNYSSDWPWGMHDQYVTSFVISYGDGNGDEKFYTDAEGEVIVFPGNSDRDTEVVNDFRDYRGPITARFIKIRPQTWFQLIAMRAKILTVTPPPEDFRVTAITGTTVKASWTATTSPSAIGYRVWIRERESSDALLSHHLNQTEITFKDLIPGTEYIISATTTDTYLEGPEVNVTVATAVPPPEDLRVTTITSTTIKALWTATTNPNAIGYRVWIRERESADALFTRFLPIGQGEVTFKDLVPATEYIISATTINMYIEGPEVQVTAVTETEPPSALDVEDRTIDSVVISWLPPKGAIVEYSISYTGDGRGTSVTSPGDAHGCKLTGLIPGTRYDIEVVAVSRVGRSIAVTMSVVTDTDPPSAMEVRSWSATWMVLVWKAPQARVVSNEITVSQTFGEELFSVDGSETSYNITELLPETDYVIKMAAVGEHGRSAEVTCSKQTGPIPLPVDHPMTSTHATTEAYTSVTWRDTTVTSTSAVSTTKRTAATSAETTVKQTTDKEVRTTGQQITTVYGTSKEDRLPDTTTYSTSTAQTTENPDEKLQHILQGMDEEQLESAKPEEILSAMNSINDVLTTSGSAESSMSLSAMEDAAALIDKLASASRGAQSASVTDMAGIANALTQAATSVIDMLPEQQPPIETAGSSNILESDLIDVNSADLSPKQQLKMLKDKQKEEEDMQKRAALNIVKSLDSVAGTLLALQPADVEYQETLGTGNVGVTVSRSPSNKDLHLGNGHTTATIPRTSSGSKTNDMLDLKMLSFKKNPYSWKQSTGGQNISSPVTVLSMYSRESGTGPKPNRQGEPGSFKEERQVNLDIPFEPVQERVLTTDAPHMTTHKPGEKSPESSVNGGNSTTMTYHRFSIPDGNVIPVLHMSWWDIDATLHVYSLYGSKPTVEKYAEKTVIQAKGGLEAWHAEKDFTVTFTPNTTRRGGVLYIGVLKIDRAGSSPEKPNRERTTDYRLQMSAVGCSSWDENNERWGLEQCYTLGPPVPTCTLGSKFTSVSSVCWLLGLSPGDVSPLEAKLDIGNNIFHCECRSTGTSIAVGTMTLPTPNSIDFLNAFMNFSNLSDNAVVLSIVVSEYILYIIIMVLLCADLSKLRGKISQYHRKTISKVSLIPPDRMPVPHVYQLTVTTGAMFGAGTTSRVGFQLFGSEGTTPIKMLNPGGEALVRGSTLHFIMPVRESLGEVMSLRIWHDNSGEGNTSAWFLGNFLVRDVEKDAVTYFCCHDWLSEDKGDGEVQRVVHATPKEELRSFSNVFTEATTNLFYDHQLWTSVLVAPPGSSFTQAQRLSCCFTLLNTMMLASAMWYQTDDTTADTKVYNLGIAHFTVEELYTSLMTALTVAPVNLMIVQLFRMEAPLAANTQEMSVIMQGRVKKHLHRWTKYMAWMTVFLASTGSAFFVLLYSMDWGKERSDAWLKAFVLSLMGSSCVMDTLQIVVLAVVLSAVCNLSFLIKPPAIRKEDLKLNLWNSAAPKKIRPPTKANCQGARKKRELSKKSASTLKELLLLFVFVAVLFYIAQANNDQNIFYETRTLSTSVLRGFDEIRTPDQFYTWAVEEVLLPTLYPSAWYNGRKMKFLDRQFAQNTESFRVGPPRLMQVRRRPDATTWKTGAGLGWSLSVQNMSYSCWRFAVPDLLNHSKFHTFNCTNHHSLDLPLDYDSAVSFFRALKDSEFLDKYTVSMAIDINFYNPSLKLFSVVHLVLDHSGVGNLAPAATITSFGLFQYESNADFVNLFIHIVFTLLFSAMVIKEAKLVKNMGWKYFTSAWNALGCLSLISTATVISVFIKRYTVAADTLAVIAKTNGELGFERFVDLTAAAWWDECLAHAVGVVVFINTVALLRVVRFSQTIGKLLALPGIMKDELLSFLVVAAVAFISFISAGYLIFGTHLKSYSDLYHTTFALFEMMLGRFFASDMLEANPLIGPIFFSAFMICIFTLLMNFLMSIVCDAISADVDVDHDHELAEHMWSSICAKLGLHSPPKKEVQEQADNTVARQYPLARGVSILANGYCLATSQSALRSGELKLQENLRIIQEQLNESLDICDSFMPSRRRYNLDEPSTSSAPQCEVKIVIQHAEDD
ncbi:hypothetical protein Bbelb_221350 [Branchiostoma belcheri]|nr:hypothetical protein Bbelb_221350 [Branchiostoma belcheri]